MSRGRMTTTQQISTGLLWRGLTSALSTLQNTSGYLVSWPLQETSGANAAADSPLYSAGELDGTHTNVAVGQAGQYRVPYVASYNGTTSKTDIYSAELNTIFDPTKGTFMIAARVANAGVWTDSTQRWVFQIGADANNSIRAVKTNVNGRLDLSMVAGGVSNEQSLTGLTTTDLFTLTITWDTVADEMNYYLNDTLKGTDSGLGTWAGNLASTLCVLGAQNTTPANVWNGDLAYASLFDEALTQPEIAKIVQSMGIPS